MHEMHTMLDHEAPARRLRTRPRRDKPCVPLALGVSNWLEARVHLRKSEMAADSLCGPLRGLYAPAGVPGTPENTVCPRQMRYFHNKKRHSVTCLAFTPDTKRLLAGSTIGEITLWDGHTFAFETVFQAHAACVRALEWRHCGDFLASADDSGIVRFWSRTLGLLTEFTAHEATKVQSISFGPRDAKMATSGDDGLVKIFDCAKPERAELVIHAHGSDARAAAWHPHLGLVASGSSRDTPVKLWDPRAGDESILAYPHNLGISKLAWDAPGKFLSTAGRDGSSAILDLRNFVRPVMLFRGHGDGVTSLAFHRECTPLLATGSGAGQLFFWSTRTDAEHVMPIVQPVPAHHGAIWALCWRQDGAALLSGSADTDIKLWARTSSRWSDLLTDDPSNYENKNKIENFFLQQHGKLF